MARTIAEIKKEMTDVYMSNSIIRDLYGITGDADFDSVFSPRINRKYPVLHFCGNSARHRANV